jgi:methionyl-tRNA formyltransferase
MARGDTDRYGWTLHYMTPRLDDGDIVLRRSVAGPVLSPGHLRALLIIDAASALAEFVRTVRRDGGVAIARLPQSDGQYFTTPTLRDWLDARRRR